MATTYSRTREQVVAAALRHLGKLAIGETAPATYTTIGLERLELILKTLKLNGYGWGKQFQGRYPLSIAAGTGAVALPSDYDGDPILNIMIDEFRDGFDRDDSATSLGTSDSGHTYSVATGATFGLESGKARQVVAGNFAYV